jgi:lysophospholipase L1-like esterase
MNRLTFLLATVFAFHTFAAETPVETDPRLHSDGKGWKLNQATIKDPKRPRVLLIGDSILSGYMAHAIKKLDGKAYVDAIKAKLPNAKLIWASSTPVLLEGDVKKLDPVINGTIIDHNRMADCGVPVSDFYALLVDKLDLARGGKDKFHWNGPAYQILGDKCLEEVLKALPTK